MLVVKHKQAKDGLAVCPRLPEPYNFMDIYCCQVCSHFAQPEEQALFITTDGIAFLEVTIGRRLDPFAEKCGIRLGSRMAFVDTRKVITTEMLEQATPEEQEILCLALAHSEKTSRRKR